MTGFIISLLLPFCVLYLLLTCLFRERLSENFIFKICLSFGTGQGMASAVYFILMASGLSGSSLKTSDITITLIFLIILTVIYYSQKHTASVSENSDILPKHLALTVLIMFLLTASAAFTGYLSKPEGGWDGWAIWNMRARFIFRSEQDLSVLLKNGYEGGHLGYPLMLPCVISRAWHYAGSELKFIPALISALFAFSCAGLLYSAFSCMGKKVNGAMASVMLLGTMFFQRQIQAQYADIPLSFFFLSALICLWRYLQKNVHALLVPAGIAAGLAAWTKNEGLVFCAGFIICALLADKRGTSPFAPQLTADRASKGRGPAKLLLSEADTAPGKYLSLAAGLFIPLTAIVIFKNTFSPPPEFTSGHGRITDLGRYSTILLESLKHIFSYSEWVFFLPVLFFTSEKAGTDAKRAATVCIFVLLIMSAGYFMAYLTSPYDLKWHIGTSAGRLITQLWPAIIFICMALVDFRNEA